MFAAPLRVLFYVQGHPELRAGGSEVYAHELFMAARERPDCDAYLLARVGPPYSPRPRPHDGTLLELHDPSDPRQYLLHQDDPDYDHFAGESPQRPLWHEHLERLLVELQPDVVHLHQVAFFGYSGLHRIRRVLPDAVVAFTLHDYGAICAHDGQLLRTDATLCSAPSPTRCRECFPTRSLAEFVVRQHSIQSHLENVDLFFAPSRFLQRQFVRWGLPEKKVRYSPYGRKLPPAPPPPAPSRPRHRCGFFGQITPYKGLPLLLRAWELLQARAALPPGAELTIHGNNIDIQSPAFRAEVESLAARVSGSVRFAGEFHRDELPRRMTEVDWVVVPSLWWENSPLVIQEAFAFGRPVVCSDVGGMAELVTHDRNGLQFRSGDVEALANTLQRALTSPGLWERLSSATPPPPRADVQIAELLEAYREAAAHRHVPV